MLDYPKLRNGLEAVPVDHQGQRLVVLRDGRGYARDTLLIPLPLAALLFQMNGENSLRDLQAYYVRKTGELLFMENLQDFVKKLDENLFLENERFLCVVSQERNQFYQDPVRRMQFAGKSYPLDPAALRAQLDGFFSGIPGSKEARSATGKRLVGLMAPHIDLTAGGVCFAHAYRAALQNDAPSTWVVLGTGHEPVENYFALTLKDFETPLGLVPCEGFTILRWDMTPDGWGILIGEAESAAHIDKAVYMWRVAGAGFFKCTKTAPALPVVDAIAQHGELLKTICSE